MTFRTIKKDPYIYGTELDKDKHIIIVSNIVYTGPDYRKPLEEITRNLSNLTNFDVSVLSYPGISSKDGVIENSGIFSFEGMEKVLEEELTRLSGKSIFLYGMCTGGATALKFASKNKVNGLIVGNSYTTKIDKKHKEFQLRRFDKFKEDGVWNDQVILNGLTREYFEKVLDETNIVEELGYLQETPLVIIATQKSRTPLSHATSLHDRLKGSSYLVIGPEGQDAPLFNKKYHSLLNLIK